MREVLPELMEWWRAGETIGVGTVVATFQSAPRPAGASMLVGPDGTAVGSVSGGCVEGAVYDLAQEVVEDGTPVLQRYGVSDDDAFAVGLTCGGILDVYVEKVNRETFPELEEVAADIEAGRPVALATVVEHPDPAWLGRRVLVRPDQPLAGHRSAAPAPTTPCATTRSGCSPSGHNATLGYGPDGERRGEGMRVFVWAFAPKPRMLVFGAIDFAAAVARVGLVPRLPRDRVRRAARLRDQHAASPRPTRSSSTGRTATSRPSARPAGSTRARCCACSPTTRSSTCRCSRSRCASTDVAYIGAMGSRRTHEDRMHAAQRGRPHRRRDRPALQPDRPRPRRPHARGDRDQHRRRDRRRPLGRLRRAASAPPPAASTTPAPGWARRSDPAPALALTTAQDGSAADRRHSTFGAHPDVREVLP